MSYKLPLAAVGGVVGYYTRNGLPYFPPDWARLRSHEVASGWPVTPRHIFERVCGAVPGLVLTDMLRSPASSLQARAEKRGVALPGHSGHNFGVSIDVAIEQTLEASKTTWATFVARMIGAGATPYRANLKPGSGESWHFNLLDLPAQGLPWGTAGADVEAWITGTYGDALYNCSWEDAQRALAHLRLYPSALVDGVPGPRTGSALEVFRRTAKLTGAQRGSGLSLSPTERRCFAAFAATVS